MSHPALCGRAAITNLSATFTTFYSTLNNYNPSSSSSLPPTDQSHSAPFSSENEAQGGGSATWQCNPPPSTSPSGETPANPPHSQPASRSRSRRASQSPSPPSTLTGTKKRSSKPTHLRRNIRYRAHHPRCRHQLVCSERILRDRNTTHNLKQSCLNHPKIGFVISAQILT